MAKHPKIGIWWDEGKHLVALAHSSNVNAFHGRYIDSNLTHVEEWSAIAGQFGKSPDDEYYETPRGRVLLDTKRNIGVVYHGSSTSKSRLAKIAKAFELKEWVAELDDHYEMGENVDFFFDDT